MLSKIFLCCLLLCLWPTASFSQWPVFDHANFAKNALTAAQMATQIDNSGREVTMMIRNMVSVFAPRYDDGLYFRNLYPALNIARGGLPLYYGMSDLDSYQYMIYPGYTNSTKWQGASANYARMVSTTLNVQRAAVNSVHVELDPYDQERYLQADLRDKVETATGAKDLAQIQAYQADLQLVEARRQRAMIGTLTQAIAIRNQHDLNMDAWTQYAQDQFFTRGRVSAQRYTGAGGISQIELR